MGGTSTDVAAVLGAEAQVTAETVVAGVPIRFPMVDVHTIGAGGGSIAWLDEGGALRVGPRSAGARPGPACYGAAERADCHRRRHLVLGYLADGACPRRRRRASTGAWPSGALARPAAPTPARRPSSRTAGRRTRRWRRRCASSASSAGSTRAGPPLVAFGGAGPLHACALAEELGIERVLVPLAPPGC